MIEASFRSKLRYRQKATPARLLEDLRGLAKLAQQARRNRRLAIIATCVLIPAGILAYGVLVGGKFLWVVAILWIVACALVCGLVAARCGRLVLDERRRSLAVRVVRALECDLAPGAKLELGIDFNPYHHRNYLVNTWSLTATRASLYRQPWLVVMGRLGDGTRLELWSDLVARRKERSKTKGRKKVKEDLHEHIRLSLRPASPPAGAARWPDLVRRSQLPLGVYCHRAAHKGQYLRLELKTHRLVRVTNKGAVESGGDIDSRLANCHHVLGPMLAAYDALADCRRG